jgi:hypothetical protein
MRSSGGRPFKTGTAMTGNGIDNSHESSVLRGLIRYPGSGGGGGRGEVDSWETVRSGRGFLERSRNVVSRRSTVCLSDGPSRRAAPVAEVTRIERDDLRLNKIIPTHPKVRIPKNPAHPRTLSFQAKNRGPPDR